MHELAPRMRKEGSPERGALLLRPPSLGISSPVRIYSPWRTRGWTSGRPARTLAWYGLLLLLAMAIAYSLGHGVGTRLPSDERQAAQRYDVPVALVMAVVQAESGGDPYAVSDQGAMGLMQVTAGKFRSGQNPFSPVTNLDVGTRYLASMLQEFHGNLRLALAAYNAGPGAVQKYHGVPPYPETQAYVKEVLVTYRRLRARGY